jgi:hypothetical protein
MQCAIYRWKALDKGYNFSLNPIAIGGLHVKLCALKITGVLVVRISRFPLGSPKTKSHLNVALVERGKIYIQGEGGGFPQVRAVGSLVSQPYFGQMWGWGPTLGKSEDLESSETPECLEFDSKAQNTSHWGVLGVIGKVLERRYIENGLALIIWTSVAQVMGKRRVGSQTGSLTPDH